MLASYREIEIHLHIQFCFGVVQKVQDFTAISRPFKHGLETIFFAQWVGNYLSFSKLFEIGRLEVLWQAALPKREQ